MPASPPPPAAAGLGDVLPPAAEPSDLLRFYKSRVEAGEAERALFLARAAEGGAAAAAASARDAAALRAREDEVRAAAS